MYTVNQPPASKEFSKAWLSACQYIQALGGDSIRWLRTDLNPPITEHISFFLGSHLIFVFLGIENINGPIPRSLFIDTAEEANAIPYILPMRKIGEEYQPYLSSGWGMLHAKTRHLFDPAKFDLDAQIEMSDWEVHDFALQVLEKNINENYGAVLSKQSSLHIDPSIWFDGQKEISYVIFRSGRFPLMEAPRPDNIDDMYENFSIGDRLGYFASITVANHDQPTSDDILPLYRGQGMMVRFTELEPLGPS